MKQNKFFFLNHEGRKYNFFISLKMLCNFTHYIMMAMRCTCEILISPVSIQMQLIGAEFTNVFSLPTFSSQFINYNANIIVVLYIIGYHLKDVLTNSKNGFYKFSFSIVNIFSYLVMGLNFCYSLHCTVGVLLSARL